MQSDVAMQAVVQNGYGSAQVLSVSTLPRPKAGPGEVVVKVQGAGIDRGTWHLMTGRPYLMRLMGFGFWRPKQPVPGIDLSGTVVELGAGVTNFKLGDQVFGIGQGTFAEYTRALACKLAKVPSGIALADASLLGVSAMTALQALTVNGGLRSGERVLIIGASGGVGTYAVQLAKALGAQVTAVCSAAKRDLVAGLGADVVLDYAKDDFADGRAQYDLILDGGGNTPLGRLRRAMTATGRLVFVGGEHGGDWTAGFGRQLLALLIAPFTRQRFVMMMAKEESSSLEQIATLCHEGKLRPVIDRRIGLGHVAQALVDMEAGKLRGKVLVQVGA